MFEAMADDLITQRKLRGHIAIGIITIFTINSFDLLYFK